MRIHETSTTLFAGVSSECRFTRVKNNKQQNICKKKNCQSDQNLVEKEKKKRKREAIAKRCVLKRKRKKTNAIATNVTSTASINFHSKNLRDCNILRTVLLVITLLLIIAIICYHAERICTI